MCRRREPAHAIPISETMTWALRLLMPGIGVINSTAMRKGARASSILRIDFGNGGLKSIDLID